MSRLLAPAVLLLCALFLLAGWNDQRLRAELQAQALAKAPAPSRVLPASAWAASLLHPAAPLPPGFDPRRSLIAWRLDPPELEGIDQLDGGPAALAARALLEEWLSLAPGAGGRATRLALVRPDPAGPFQLEAELAGTPVAILTWVRALLAQPAHAGLLADPRRVQLAMVEDELQAELQIVVWPLPMLMGGAE